MKSSDIWTIKYILALFCLPFFVSGQNSPIKLKDIVLKVDTLEYTYSKSTLEYRGYKYFYFEPTNQSEIVEITFLPYNIDNIKSVSLQSSLDFFIIDSITQISDDFFRGKIQFNDLTQVKFPRFVVQIIDANDKVTTEEIKLYPFFKTRYESSYEVDELFEGEEKIINIPVVNGTNIRFDEGWNTSKNIEYKLSTTENNIQVFVHPLQPGYEEVKVKIRTIKPYLNEYNNLTYDLPLLTLKFSVKPSRINYLNIDQSEFFYDPQFKSNIQVQIDLNRNIGLKKTYRVESQQEPGGKLVAELFTQSQVGNSNKILAWLRPYSLHRISDGYLYIKDDDITKFITNFDIIEKPSIEKLSILREGEDWNSNLAVNPGEKLEVKIEGTGLLKAQIQFDAVSGSKIDTTRRSDNVLFYFIKVPIDFPKRKISVFMNNNITRYEMLIREYQIPKELDFISISYEKELISVTNEKFNKPVLYRDPIEDVVLSFDSKRIDNIGKVYGKQFLSIEIKLFNSSKDLIEIQRIENIVICPGENSPRYAFYDLKDCRKGNINLNDYLLHKTYDMEGWSTLEITIKHNEGKYGIPGNSKRITLIKEKLLLLDLQVSFPTGLLVKRFNQAGIGNLTGISTAFLTQLSFYDSQKIGRLRPYKIGFGLIALDVFNLNDNNKQRDLGLVIIGSLLPLRKDTRFSFPLYGGFGYLIKNNTWFAVFGPGIQFNF